MRCCHHIIHPEQHIVGCRLGFKHIQRRTGNMPGAKRGCQCQLVNQPAARAVDDPDTLFCPVQRICGQDIPRLVRQRCMQADEIGICQQLVQIDLLDTCLTRMFRGHKRVKSDHLHAQPAGAVGNDAANISAADQPQRLAGDLGPQKAGFFPFAGLCRCICQRYLAGQGQHHGDGMFGCRHRIAVRRIHHHDTTRRCRGDIDIIDTNAGPAHNLQLCRGGQQIAGHLGGGPDGQPVIITNDRSDFVC